MNIQYKEGFEVDEDDDPSYGQNIMLARKVLRQMNKETDKDIVSSIKTDMKEREDIEEPMMAEQEEAPDVSKGLMARVLNG